MSYICRCLDNRDMKKLFKSLKERNERRKKRNKEMELEQKFSVCARGGKLFITCYDIAVEELTPKTTVEEIINKLNKMIAAHDNFEKVL